MNKLAVICAAFLAACSGAAPHPAGLPAAHGLDPAIERALGRLVDAHDAPSIRGLLAASISDGGLWFDDAGCRDQFAEPRAIAPDELDAFAGCLAALPFARSARTSRMPNVAVLAYAPGIELEAAFRIVSGKATLTWIGYAGRRGPDDVLPTITGDALEALRTDGPRGPTNSDDSMSWLKVCLDEAGNVQSVLPRWTSSIAALEAAMAAAQQWTFRAFAVDGTRIAACAMVAVADPSGADVVAPSLPLSVPDGLSAAVGISPKTARPITGDLGIVPYDTEMEEIYESGVARVTSSFQICVGESGEVLAVTLMESSGYKRYDQRAIDAMLHWTYAPVALDGTPLVFCTEVTLLYQTPE